MCYKVSFKTYHQAYQRLKYLKSKNPLLKTAYRCEKCHSWHLTKMTLIEYKQKNK